MAYFPAKAQTASRQQGVLNRKTQGFELALWHAYEAQDGFNGVQGLKQLAREQPAEFFRALVKRLPEIQSEQAGITVIVQRQGQASNTEAVQINPYRQDGGELPDSRGQGLGPDLGTAMHENGVAAQVGQQDGTLKQSSCDPQAEEAGGYFGRPRTGNGSPQGS
jgi:hypothetical protein